MTASRRRGGGERLRKKAKESSEEETLTRDDGFEGTAGDSDAAILDLYHVVPGSHWSVRDLVSVVHLGARHRDLGRAVEVDSQGAASGVGCYHGKLAHLAC